MTSATGPVLIAGAGIAGMAGALSLAAVGRECRLFERTARLEEVGAGLQLSPNATRILRRLGVLDRLDGVAARPNAVVLRRADTGREISRLPLGRHAEARWGAPYLTVHRADLQHALLDAVQETPGLELHLGAAAEKVEQTAEGVRLVAGGAEHDGEFLLATDGVRSAVRAQLEPSIVANPSGHVAWRVTVPADNPGAKRAEFDPTAVTTYMHPDIHLVVYPIRGGKAFNLVAVSNEAGAVDAASFPARLAHTAEAFAPLGIIKDWLAWPLFEVSPHAIWRHGETVAFAGDAAHAVTPFAAQGAVMAIEDGATLAASLARQTGVPAALAQYAKLRDPRVVRVARRGALNHFTWHATGPTALARDMMLKLSGGSRLAAQFDWLYGFDATAA